MDDNIFCLFGSDGESQVISFENTSKQSIHLSEVYYLLQVKEISELTWLEVNGEDVDLDDSEVLSIPIVCRSDYSASMITWIDGNEYACDFYFDEKKFINVKSQIAYSDFRSRLMNTIKSRVKIEEVVQMVNSGNLPLLRMLNPEAEVRDDSLIKYIDKKLQFAFNICNRPRLHLRSETELLDIERVKRVNEQSLRHLASHSEHWKARTLSGIVPGRMNAEIYEDDYNIYENIFFRMAIERIAKLVYDEASDLRSAINQNDNLIDWSKYSNQFTDYTRMKLISEILSDFDLDEFEYKNEEYKEVLELIESIEKRILGIQWSRNYQKINKTKVLSRPIIPTNILNMDKNYHEIYKLWNQIEKEAISMPTAGVEGDGARVIHESYYDFVATVVIHALSQLDIKVNQENSFVEFLPDKGLKLNVCCNSDQFEININSVEDGLMFQCIELNFKEKLNLKLSLPESCLVEDFDTLVFEGVYFNKEDNTVSFINKLKREERKEIGFVYKKLSSRTTDEKKRRKYQKADKEWRKLISDHLDNARELREYKVLIAPIILNFDIDEIDFDMKINKLFHRNYESDSVYFVAPFELFKKENYDSFRLQELCLNFGDVPYNEFRNYERGFIPISQIEVNSVSRIMKVVKMTMARLSIDWQLDKIRCPICGSLNIHQIDHDTSKCDNLECGVEWGRTHCTGECGKYFSWIRPDIQVESEPYREMSHLQIISKKESWFGSRVITDFEIDLNNKYIRFLPRCPYCG